MAEGGSIAPKKTKRWSLDCSICLERFRNPRTLPCLHSYCEECLVNYTTKGAKSIKCPQCKEDALVPDGDATKFKSNFHLKELVEEAALTAEIGQPSLNLLCNCCAGGLEAVSRCLECDQYLCSDCVKAHGRFPSLRSHVVASLQEIRDGKVIVITIFPKWPIGDLVNSVLEGPIIFLSVIKWRGFFYIFFFIHKLKIYIL